MKKLAEKNDRFFEKIETTKPQDECLTALPPTIDIAALAALYNSPTASPVAHENLLEEARRALGKYELVQADLELAADSLARAMHMLVEQHGLKKLPPEQIAELERDVLDWFGLCPIAALPNPLPVKTSNADTARSSITLHKPITPLIPHPVHNTHGTARPH